MKESEMEQMLEKFCREQIEPPEHLVVYTMQKLKRNRFLNMIVFLSLFVNGLITFSITIMVFLPVLRWSDKIFLYFSSNMFFNGLIVLILLNKEKIITFFKELNLAVNYQR